MLLLVKIFGLFHMLYYGNKKEAALVMATSFL